ncbi:MAG: hypothetical protein DMG76_22300 [Acidobacteria bacterium]|nr:MAG: hypothetical protein DMG76_22300 [Acidobacteriota bacterium]
MKDLGLRSYQRVEMATSAWLRYHRRKTDSYRWMFGFPLVRTRRIAVHSAPKRAKWPLGLLARKKCPTCERLFTVLNASAGAAQRRLDAFVGADERREARERGF